MTTREERARAYAEELYYSSLVLPRPNIKNILKRNRRLAIALPHERVDKAMDIFVAQHRLRKYKRTTGLNIYERKRYRDVTKTLEDWQKMTPDDKFDAYLATKGLTRQQYELEMAIAKMAAAEEVRALEKEFGSIENVFANTDGRGNIIRKKKYGERLEYALPSYTTDVALSVGGFAALYAGLLWLIKNGNERQIDAYIHKANVRIDKANADLKILNKRLVDEKAKPKPDQARIRRLERRIVLATREKAKGEQFFINHKEYRSMGWKDWWKLEQKRREKDKELHRKQRQIYLDNKENYKNAREVARQKGRIDYREMILEEITTTSTHPFPYQS